MTKEVPATLKQVQFNATLKYNEDHKVYRPVTQPSYVGPPSPEIDAAWDEIMGGKPDKPLLRCTSHLLRPYSGECVRGP